MARRLARILTAVLASVALVALATDRATPARADGDPASDVLLGEDVFYPYQPPVTRSLEKTLNAATAAARKAKAPIKIALIATPVDLGVIPDLFGHPQKYADFLDQEISFRGKQPLLVVMPAGYGSRGLSAKAQAAIAALPKPAGAQTNDLAKAAITAVSKIAVAEGHPITGVPGVPSAGGSGGSNSTLIIILVAAAVVTAGVLAVLTLRRRSAAA
jgi:hypothetical protein